MGNNHPVGIFDSGVGGLTVVKAFLEQLPFEDFIYFGDTVHVPYGSKTETQLCQYARDIMGYFMSRGVKAVLVACGTHSSVTLPSIQSDYPVPMVGMVKAGARAAARSTKSNRIGVLATQATVNSHAYTRAIQEINASCQVFEVACPQFVPLVEAGHLVGDAPAEAARQYITPLLQENIDTLVLGCTHYPFLSPVIAGVIGEVTLLDPATEAVAELKDLLTMKALLKDNSSKTHTEFLVSGDEVSFQQVGRRLLGEIVKEVKNATLVPC